MSDHAALITFIRARINEDDQIVNRAAGGKPTWSYDRETFAVWADSGAWCIAARRLDDQPICDVDGEHIAHWDPKRILAEVEVKRRILEVVQLALVDDEIDQTAQYMLWVLATPYASHPDYDPAWAPSEVERS